MTWRSLSIALWAMLPACAGGASHGVSQLPDWDGPAVNCRHGTGGAFRVEMVTMTAGHAFELLRVEHEAGLAAVHVRYAPPTGDLVAQVVTTLPIDIAAADLRDATAVQVWVHRGLEGADACLAAAVARPRN